MERKYQLDLPVALTDEEIWERGIDLANQNVKSCELESKIHEIKAKAKTEIKGIDEKLLDVRARIRELAIEIKRGESISPVTVKAYVADDNSCVEIVRLDTGEIVSSRPLTEDDRQMQIDDVLSKIECDTVAAEKEKYNNELVDSIKESNAQLDLGQEDHGPTM